MPILDAVQLAYADFVAGFRGNSLRDIVATQLAESSGNSGSINNSAYPTLSGYHAPGATDAKEFSVGISQVNALVHYQASGLDFVSYVSKLFDPLFNASEAFRISSGGSDLGPWSTYSNGSYLSHINEATLAVQAVSGGQTVSMPTGTQTVGAPGWWNKIDPTNPDNWAGLSGIGGALAPIGDAFKSVGKVFATLGDRVTWWRIGFVIAAGSMIFLGVNLMMHDAIGRAAETAVKAV